MDEFGVLVESIGFKAQGRSAPMSKLKQHKPNSPFTPTNTSSFVDSSSTLPDLDRIFRSSSNNNINNNYNYNDDIFGRSNNVNQFDGGAGFESVFVTSSSTKTNHNVNSNYNSYDDLFGLNENQTGGNVVHDHDDVFGFLGVNSTPTTSTTTEKKASGFDDLLPGFGGVSGPSNQGIHTKAHLSPPRHHSPHLSSKINDDPFLVFEKDAKKSSIQVSLDDLDDFVTGRGHKEPINNDQTRNKTDNTSVRNVSSGFENVDDLLFGVDVRQKPDRKPSSTAKDSQFDFLFNEVKPKVQPSPNTRKYSRTDGVDITALFGDVAVSTVEFQEIDDEPEDRRDARFKRYMRMKQRMDTALEEKNQRDLQSQYEQEEKHRLAESLDYDIKRWAAGKEGNLRALLSTLEQVLWPECGWRAVSLTDMITSVSVKKVYNKATLCVHPDKVQQKGANIQQKYIAEKVFDILKEAWNKFRTEELQ